MEEPKDINKTGIGKAIEQMIREPYENPIQKELRQNLEHQLYSMVNAKMEQVMEDFKRAPISLKPSVVTIQFQIDALPAEDRAQLSDGFHSFEELYETRNALILCLARTRYYRAMMEHKLPQHYSVWMPWRSKIHSDGTTQEGWFLLGFDYRKGKQVSFHLPMKMWDDCYFATELDKAPPFDGHTTKDVIERLKAL